MSEGVAPVSTAGRPQLRANSTLSNPSKFGSVYGSNQGVDPTFAVTPQHNTAYLTSASSSAYKPNIAANPAPKFTPRSSGPDGLGENTGFTFDEPPPPVTAQAYTPEWRHQIGAQEEWRVKQAKKGATIRDVLDYQGVTGKHEGGAAPFVAQYGPGGFYATHGAGASPGNAYDWEGNRKLNIATGNPGNEGGPQPGTKMGPNGKLHFDPSNPEAWNAATGIDPSERAAYDEMQRWSAANPGLGYWDKIQQDETKRLHAQGDLHFDPSSGLYFNDPNNDPSQRVWVDSQGRRVGGGTNSAGQSQAGQSTATFGGGLTSATVPSTTSNPQVASNPAGVAAKSTTDQAVRFAPPPPVTARSTAAGTANTQTQIPAFGEGSGNPSDPNYGGKGGEDPRGLTGGSPTINVSNTGAGIPGGLTTATQGAVQQTGQGGPDLSPISTSTGQASASTYQPQGPSGQETAMLSAITQLAQMLQGQGESLFQVGMPAYAKAIDYYKTLLGGSPAAMGAATAPASELIREQGKGAAASIGSGFLRGGAKDNALAELQRGEASDIAHLTQGVQPAAASALMSGGLSGTGQATAAESAGGQFYTAALSNLTQGRQFEEGLAENSKQFSASLAEQVRSNNLSYNQAMAGLALQKLLEGNRLAEQITEFGKSFGLQQDQFSFNKDFTNRQFTYQQQEDARQRKLQLGLGIGQLGTSLLGGVLGKNKGGASASASPQFGSNNTGTTVDYQHTS